MKSRSNIAVVVFLVTIPFIVSFGQFIRRHSNTLKHLEQTNAPVFLSNRIEPQFVLDTNGVAHGELPHQFIHGSVFPVESMTFLEHTSNRLEIVEERRIGVHSLTIVRDSATSNEFILTWTGAIAPIAFKGVEHGTRERR